MSNEIKLCGGGYGMAGACELNITDDSVRLVINNRVVFLETYGENSPRTFEEVWASVGVAMRYYLQNP